MEGRKIYKLLNAVTTERKMGEKSRKEKQEKKRNARKELEGTV